MINLKKHLNEQSSVFLVRKMVCLMLVAGVWVATGCHKKQPPEPAPAQQAAAPTNPAAAPVYTRPANTTVVAPAPTGEPDLKQMTRSLRSWVSRTHIVPTSFENFVAQANIQFPPPPEGKKFVIGKRMTVELARQ